MHRLLRLSCIWLVVLFLAAPPPRAGGADTPAPAGPPAFKPEEIDQLLAPIALYPDELISQVLMAATYPLEVVEADRWAKQNKNVKGDALGSALEKQTWDPSVKSLVNFPDVLAMMSDKLDWTQKLGDAFLSQQDDVMNGVQRLRAQAQKAGNLQTTEQQKVVVEQQVIKIEPANPQVVYVPTYNPTVVYGAWAYPAYPPYPVYPPGYVAGAAVAGGRLRFRRRARRGVGLRLGRRGLAQSQGQGQHQPEHQLQQQDQPQQLHQHQQQKLGAQLRSS
jgi:hypothetical protein